MCARAPATQVSAYVKIKTVTRALYLSKYVALDLQARSSAARMQRMMQHHQWDTGSSPARTSGYFVLVVVLLLVLLMAAEEVYDEAKGSHNEGEAGELNT